MRRGRHLVILVLVALGAILTLWVCRDRARDGSVDQRGSTEGALEQTQPPGLDQAAPTLAWLRQRSAEGRRIAGRVVHGGRPVAKAQVRLTTEELRIGEWPLAELETDSDGRFDFGAWPPIRYQVVAQAEGLAAGGVAVELRARDPRPPPDDLTIELRDCELVITGTVRDAAGGVIAGARVRAASRAEVFAGALSDEEGHYRVCLLAGPAHLEASADGYGTVLEHTRGRRRAGVDFALSPEVAIAGRVVDGSGQPVEGAAVVAETDGHDPGALTESAADGRFRLEGLVAGTYRVVARDGDQAAEKTVAVTATGATDELLLTLGPRAILTGRVTVGGRPTADATVIARVVDEKWVLGTAVTQADGRFAIQGLPRGPVKLEVENHKLLSPKENIDLTLVSQVELVCERLAAIRGRVMRAGKPVAHAEVNLFQDWKRPHTTTSKDDGAFEFEGVDAASYEIAASSLAEGANMGRRPIAVGAQDITGLVLDLDLTASIAGAVVETTGAPVAGVTVRFTLEDGESRDDPTDTTDVDGTFLVGGLRAGSYRPQVLRSQQVWSPYSPASGRRHATVVVADGTSHVKGVQLAISRGLTIAGRVVRRGEPVAGVVIVASSHVSGGHLETQSAADGTFLLEGLAEGPHGVRADRLGGEFIEVKAGATNVVLELPATGTIEGVLRGFRARPEVRVSGQNRGLRADVIDMRFALADVAIGEYDVSATASSGEHATAHVTVTADQVSRVTLTASATATITGVVKDLRTGAPVAGVHCSWSVGDSAAQPVPADDATGAFSLAVPAGSVGVDCFGMHGSVVGAREVKVDLEPGTTAHVTVQVISVRHTRSGTIGVHVEDADSGAHPILFLKGTAASSGLRVGDLLLAVDGLPVTGLAGHVVHLLMVDRPIGATAKLTVDRQGTQLSFDVAVEPRAMQPDDQ
jgi:hypothetical protein